MPWDDDPSEDASDGSLRVRRRPVQARSEARIEVILDAAADIISRAGLEDVTTTVVARDAGMSIGAVYRYFPDRQGLVLALARRNLDRYMALVGAALRDPHVREWTDALDCGLDSYLVMCAKEPGFSRLRFGGWIEKLMLGESRGRSDVVAEGFASVFVERFGVAPSPDLRMHLLVAIDIADALLTRAFACDPSGDTRLIDECRCLVHDYLTERLEQRPGQDRGEGATGPLPTEPW